MSAPPAQAETATGVALDKHFKASTHLKNTLVGVDKADFQAIGDRSPAE